MAMKLISQRDYRWSQKKIGQSNLTVGRFGCTISSLSMLSSWYDCFMDPGQIADKPWFTPAGLVDWTKLHFETFRFVKRVRYFDFAAVADALRGEDTAVILEVDNSHWVVATGFYPWNRQVLRIADPWFGDKSTTKRYGKVTGFAVFTRK